MTATSLSSLVEGREPMLVPAHIPDSYLTRRHTETYHNEELLERMGGQRRGCFADSRREEIHVGIKQIAHIVRVTLVSCVQEVFGREELAYDLLLLAERLVCARYALEALRGLLRVARVLVGVPLDRLLAVGLLDGVL